MLEHGTSDDQEQSKLAAELVRSGAEIAGAAVGGIMGSVGGPVGIIGGAASGVAVSRILQHVGSEVQRRLLSPRQRIRSGAVFAIAGSLIAARIDAGDDPRGDGFFETTTDDRSAAEETLEGIISAARDSFEERKIPLLGRLYANLLFETRIDRPYANYLIGLAEALTYTQLMALAFAASEDRTDRIRQKSYVSDASALAALSHSGQGLLTSIYDLSQRGLISGGDGNLIISVSGVNPGTFSPQAAGAWLVELMQLRNTKQSDIAIFYETFGR